MTFLKYFSWIFIFGFQVLTVVAQVAPENSINKYKASPQAYFLQGKVDFRVNHTSGNPDISINLYEFELNGLKIPLILTYRSYGFQVNGESTEIGLGWNLEFGGSIVQQGNGFFDNNNENGFAEYANKTNKLLSPGCSYLPNTSIAGDCNLDYYNMKNSLAVPQARYQYVQPDPFPGAPYRFVFSGMGPYNSMYDYPNTEVDMFYFQIPNYSGKYFYGSDRKTHQIPFSKNIIQNNSITDIAGNVYNFDVSSGVGVKYKGTFKRYKSGASAGGVVEDENSYGTRAGDIITQRTSYLTNIRTRFGEVVDFDYYDSKYSSQNPTVISIRNENNNYQNINRYTPSTESYYNQILWSRNEVISKLTKSMKINGRTIIEFEYSSSPRKDVYYEPNNLVKTKALQRIIIRNFNGDVVKKIDFNQSYFGYDINIEGNQDKMSRYYRLKLNSVNINGDEEYKFDYYDDGLALPSKSQVDKKDHWGYFNNMSFPINTTRPTLTYVQNLKENYRASNLVGTRQTVLRSITYPTKGSDVYYYGLNQDAGGIKVDSIRSYSDDKLQLQKNYEYEQANSYYSPQYHHYEISWRFLQDTPTPVSSAIIEIPITVQFSSPFNDIVGFSGSPVFYSKISESIKSANSVKLLGKEVFEYTYFPDIIGEGGSTMNTYSKTVDYGWKRGHLLSRTIFEFDESNKPKLRKRIRNEYNFNDTKFLMGDVVHPDVGFPTKFFANEYQYSSYRLSLRRPEVVWDSREFFELIADNDKATIDFTVERYISAWFYKSKEIIETFTDADSIEQIREFKYDNPAHAQVTSILSVLSSGKRQIHRYKYVYDLMNIEPYNNSIYAALVSKNLIAIPLISEIVENDVLIYQDRLEFGYVGHDYFPQRYFIDVGKNSYSKGALVEYLSYNANGNLQEFVKKGNVRTVYLWGYSGQYPIA
ncbi:hypothetical protein HP439_12330, partial [Sphingobacterium shayense]|uniref:hypothetical protein n=1 Tax=Sphingobacterium shayense TaxID=626343 RepID=UPI001557F236